MRAEVGGHGSQITLLCGLGSPFFMRQEALGGFQGMTCSKFLPLSRRRWVTSQPPLVHIEVGFG